MMEYRIKRRPSDALVHYGVPLSQWSQEALAKHNSRKQYKQKTNDVAKQETSIQTDRSSKSLDQRMRTSQQSQSKVESKQSSLDRGSSMFGTSGGKKKASAALSKIGSTSASSAKNTKTASRGRQKLQKFIRLN